jgi:hypothetical protein
LVFQHRGRPPGCKRRRGVASRRKVPYIQGKTKQAAPTPTAARRRKEPFMLMRKRAWDIMRDDVTIVNEDVDFMA